MINTGYYSLPSNFENGLYNKKEPTFKMKNTALRSLLSAAETEMIKLESSGVLKNMDAKKVKEHIEGALFGKEAISEKPKTFIDYLDEFINLKTNRGTILSYTTTKNKITAFDKDCTFETIDRKWLSSFEKWMAEGGMKINAYAIHLRNIRAVFNYAIDEEKTNLYPFRKFKIKKEETRKRCLTLEQLQLLSSYNCDKYQERYRDMFMLIFYLIGINIGNLLCLKEENLVNGRIEYHRNKTNKLYSIKVEPEAMNIINKYRGKNYLLNIMDEYSNYKNFIKRMNTSLKQIGETTRHGLGGKKERKTIFPELSSYWARHTWATIAADLDIPKETISAALGHTIGSDITSIYIKFNQKKIDQANRMVIDYVKNNKA